MLLLIVPVVVRGWNLDAAFAIAAIGGLLERMLLVAALRRPRRC